MMNTAITRVTAKVASAAFIGGVATMFLAFLSLFLSFTLPLQYLALVPKVFGTTFLLGLGLIGVSAVAGLAALVRHIKEHGALPY